MGKLIVKNPFGGEVLAELSHSDTQDTAAMLTRATQAFQRWRHSSAWERSQLLTHAEALLRSSKKDFADLICKEAGKPIRLAELEVDRAIQVLNWSAAEALRFSGEMTRLDVTPNSRHRYGLATRFPRGVVLGITPFNFPLNLVMHKIAPALATGCAIIIKPSPFTPLTALKIAELFKDLFSSGPQGLVQVALTDDAATARLTEAREIATVSFTGSARVGWLVRRQAAEKPVLLELGGNAWAIVHADTPPAQFGEIAKRITGAAYSYAGQSCISVQNVAVAAEIWKEFSEHLRAATQATPYGDPSRAEVVCGPVIHEQAAARLRDQLVRSASQIRGASNTSSDLIFIASNPPSAKSPSPASHPTLVAPTLVELGGFPNQGQELLQEEIFGPVMTALPYARIEEVISWINSSQYGLQAGLFSQSWPLIERLYRELEVGGLVVGDVPTTRYDHQPYGGVKASGIGREGARHAMDEMTELRFLALG